MKSAIVFIALVALTTIAGFAFAKAHHGHPPIVETEPKVKGTPTLKLRSIDLPNHRALVEVGGLTKPPLANFFTFTDERDRHFVAMSIHCDEPFPSGVRVCELDMPIGYERHRLTSLILHVHGLHGRPVEVAGAEVRDAWDAAQQEVHELAPVDGGADAAP